MAACLPTSLFVVVVALTTSILRPTFAVCVNCQTEDAKSDASVKVDHEQLQKTLQLLDSHFANAMITRLNSVVSKIRLDLDNVTDVQITFPRREPDIVKRFSPIPVASSRMKRVLRRGRHKRDVCKKEFILRPVISPHLVQKSKIVVAQLEIPKSIYKKIRKVSVASQDHHHPLRRRMHSQLEPDFTQHDRVTFRLPKRYKKLTDGTSELRVVVDYVGSCAADGPHSSELEDIRLVYGLNELTADQAKRRFGRSTNLNNEFKIIRDCAEAWDKSFLDSNDSVSALQIFECCRRKVRLNFDDTSLGGWVRSPKSFNAFYCIGRCARFGNFASDRNGDTDGEGFYATLMNAQSSALGVRPCCAPVAFRPLTVTTQHGSSEETTQTLSDFIVTSCGCV
uniref:TGF-beta family profile domain-containing protein n=1 Tax=Plectus sambesii TaxID=2011161 RepID=A0A914VF31_9BILA